MDTRIQADSMMRGEKTCPQKTARFYFPKASACMLAYHYVAPEGASAILRDVGNAISGKSWTLNTLFRHRLLYFIGGEPVLDRHGNEGSLAS